MIPKVNTSYYGNGPTSFIGKVINVNDPLQLGRVQIRIFGIHTENINDIPVKGLPWALTVIPTTEPGVSGLGLPPALKPFSTVYGIFADGDNAQEPVILGSVPNYGRDDLLKKEKFDFNTTLPSPHDFRIPAEKPFFNDPDKLLPGGTNNEKAFLWFQSTAGGGYSPIVAAAIVGNLWHEGTNPNDGPNRQLNPDQKELIKDNDSGKLIPGPGFGIAQWTQKDRRQELYDRAKSISVNTMYHQLSFITYELDSYAYLGKAQLINAKTVEEASDIFMTKFERPKDQSLEKKKPRRKTSRDFLVAFTKGN